MDTGPSSTEGNTAILEGLISVESEIVPPASLAVFHQPLTLFLCEGRPTI